MARLKIMTAMPEPILEMLFDGLELLPENISLGKLSQAFSAVQRLASGQYVSREDEPEDEEADDSLRLLDVQRGSAVYRITGPSPDAPIANIRKAGSILEEPDEAGDSDYVINPVEDLSRIARSLACRIVLRKPGSIRPLATVDSDSYHRIAGRLIVEGDTAFTGKVQRVGGKMSNRCALSVPFQHRMIYCLVESPDLARTLGQRLYQDVVVQGTARWLRGSWKLFSFRVKDVYQPKKGGIREAFKALHDAGGKGWDQIEDPAKFLEEVTGE
jgi:hypothetical protein